MIMWIASPARSVSIIDNRLNLLETFFLNEALMRDIRFLLEKSQDTQRILQKLSLGRGNAGDLIGLAHTIEITQKILERLAAEKYFHEVTMKDLVKELDVPLDLAKTITKAIDEEGLMQQQRIEESEATISAALAQAQELGGGGGDGVPGPSLLKKAKTVGPIVGRRMINENHMEKLEAWIMQKRFGINYCIAFCFSTFSRNRDIGLLSYLPPPFALVTGRFFFPPS